MLRIAKSEQQRMYQQCEVLFLFLLECSISHVKFEFRKLATMLFNSLEKV